jgi:CMP/dCMP kinase
LLELSSSTYGGFAVPAPTEPAAGRPLVIAVDGPSGSGKSSVSREVAIRLGLEYIDTGAMYRAACWAVLDAGIDPAEAENAAAVAKHVQALDLQLGTNPSVASVVVAGQEITEAIRETRISTAVSAVAVNLEVRAELHQRQRELIDAARRGVKGGCVVEGRDITTVVAPDADVRILLTASEAARLARRAREVHGSDDDAAVEATKDQILRRDADDSAVSDFQVAADGVLHLDSSGLDFEQTVDAVLAAVSHTAAGNLTELLVDHHAGAGSVRR